MSYSISALDDCSIILITPNDDFDIASEFMPLITEAVGVMDATVASFVMILDASALQIRSMDDATAIGMVTRTDVGQRFGHHYNLTKLFAVAQHAATSMTLQGMHSATFGNIDIFVVDNLDDALHQARELIRELYEQVRH